MIHEKMAIISLCLIFLTGCALQVRQHDTGEAAISFPGTGRSLFSPSGRVEPGESVDSRDGLFSAREIEPYGQGRIGVFSKESGEMLSVINAQEVPNDLKGISWSNDGLAIAVMYHGGDPAGISLYDPVSGERLRTVDVPEDFHYMSFGEANHILYLSSDGSDWMEVNLRNTDFTLFSGVNLPWINYGWDVGRNPWGGRHGGFSSNREKLREDFLLLRENGVRLVRIFVFCDLRSGIVFDESGVPSGFDGFVEKDFSVLLDAAAESGLSLIPVLFDYTIADGVEAEENVRVGEFQTVFTDPVKKKMLLKIFRGFFRKFAGHPSVFAWDIINEPEHITAVPEKDMHEFLADFIRLIRGSVPGTRVTVGLLNRADMNRWEKCGLDIYQFHYFDSFEAALPLDFPAVRLSLDKPVIAGELESTNIPAKLTTLWENGYRGGLFWGLNDGGFRQNAYLFRAWMSVH